MLLLNNHRLLLGGLRLFPSLWICVIKSQNVFA
jgi:hypothetical protein